MFSYVDTFNKIMNFNITNLAKIDFLYFLHSFLISINSCSNYTGCPKIIIPRFVAALEELYIQFS